MMAAGKLRKIEDLIAKADDSLRREMWFEAERLAIRALTMARQEQAFDIMARALPPLQEARRQRMRLATERNTKIVVVDTAVTEDMKLKPGCYLVRPPLVGLDARRLRLIALTNEVPVIVVCIEPLTKLKFTPIVAIGPGSTLRVKVSPPNNPPDKPWMVEALRELGDWAISSMDVTLPPVRRVDLLLEYLDALPEHDDLHYALEAACRDAMGSSDAGEEVVADDVEDDGDDDAAEHDTDPKPKMKS